MKIKLGIIGFGGMGKWHAENAPHSYLNSSKLSA